MMSQSKVDFQKIILGTANFGQQYGATNSQTLNDYEVFEILDYAQNLGITTLDTANVYGRSEEIIGKFHKSTGETFKINSKLVNIENLTFVENMRQIENTIERLNIDSLENLLFHNINAINSDKPLNVFIEKVLESKYIKESMGVSIYNFHDSILANSKYNARLHHSIR